MKSVCKIKINDIDCAFARERGKHLIMKYNIIIKYKYNILSKRVCNKSSYMISALINLPKTSS